MIAAPGGGVGPYVATAIETTLLAQDNLESTGLDRQRPGDNATTGIWSSSTRTAPTPLRPTTTTPSRLCYVTSQGSAGARSARTTSTTTTTLIYTMGIGSYNNPSVASRWY